MSPEHLTICYLLNLHPGTDPAIVDDGCSCSWVRVTNMRPLNAGVPIGGSGHSPLDKLKNSLIWSKLATLNGNHVSM